MTSSLTPLKLFLHQAKKHLHTSLKQKSNGINIVVGNESADLDSMTSALTYAYLASLPTSLSGSSSLLPSSSSSQSVSTPKPSSTNTTAAVTATISSSTTNPTSADARYHQANAGPSSNEMHIPLLNIPAADITLRPEFTIVLRQQGITPAELITLDDLSWPNPPSSTSTPPLSLPDPSLISFTLVDHNALTGPLATHYAHLNRVTAIIDHHADEHLFPTARPRTIRPAGSCSSLVLQHFAHELQTRDRASVAGAAVVALASILVDTRDMKAPEKVTEVDSEAVRLVEHLLPAPDSPEYRWLKERYYSEVDGAKADISGLGLRDILRKDYKEWKENGIALGIASVVKELDWLKSHASSAEAGKDPVETFLGICQGWARERNLDILAVMTGFSLKPENSPFQRELFVWALTPSSVPIVKKFEQINHSELQLEDFPSAGLDEFGAKEWRKSWNQLAIKHSRKRVAPMLRDSIVSSNKL